MSIKFNDCILNSNNKFFNFCENYLYVKGISNTLGFRTFCIHHNNHSVINVRENSLESLKWQQVATAIVKIVSYIIFPLLPLLALIGKEINRKLNTFQISENDKVNETIQPLLNQNKPKSDENSNDQKFLIVDENINIPEFIPLGADIRDETWLDASHIEGYSKFLALEHSDLFIPLPFAYTTDLVKAFYQKIDVAIFQSIDSQEIDLSKKMFLAYPLKISDNHWTLIFIDRIKRTIEFYDSKKNYGNHEEVIKYLEKFTNDFSIKDPGEKSYTFIRKINTKLQPDSYQCGIWTLYFLENRLKNPDIDFNKMDIKAAQKIIANYRKKVMIKLIDIQKNGIPRQPKKFTQVNTL